MKKLIFLILLFPALAFAKEYKVKITPCDKSSNCTKCYEQVDLTYTVDEKLRFKKYVNAADEQNLD